MYVVVASIGPVQEFIVSARKCRDLWFGSWLLSELSRATARKVAESEGHPEGEVLIFPGAKTSDQDRSVANKIVARIREEPRSLMLEAERAMRTRLSEIRELAFARVAPEHQDRVTLFKIDVARAQVDALIEFLWAAAPETNGYSAARIEAERLLAAAKVSKTWEQPTWAKDGVVKSSLDGIRESVLDETLFDNPRVGVASANVDDRRRRREFGVHGSERLCGVGILKRFGNRDVDGKRNTESEGKVDQPHRIFSTAHVASGPFRAGLQALQADAHWVRYRNELGSIERRLLTALDVVPRRDPTTGEVDGSVFYEGRIVEELDELSMNAEQTKRVANKATAALRKFLCAVSSLGEPNPYYAILLADGDYMGSVIDACNDFARHRALSATLEGFASATRATVEEHEGNLIYSGGDDVLALVPLHRTIECARRLASDFGAIMKTWTARIDGVERSPTLSLGVAIVHYMLPLDQALEIVRRAEQRAKALDGKNALAITVKRRGGEAVGIVDRVETLAGRLTRLVSLHLEDRISTKAQYELMDLAGRTEGAGDAGAEEILRRVASAEAQRILARKQSRHGVDTALEAAVIHELERYEAFTDPARLGRELYVAAELARAEAQASPRTRRIPTRQEEAT